MNPHDYALFIREYPKWFDMDGIETVFVTDFILRKMKEKGVTPTTAIEGKFAYHDPCTLNKLVVEADSPRELVGMVPGAEIIDVEPGNQWRYCCGNGNGPYRKLHEDIAYRIGQKRLRAAADLGVDTILVACPHCKDQFTDVKAKAGLPVEPVHVLEILAKSMGIEWTDDLADHRLTVRRRASMAEDIICTSGARSRSCRRGWTSTSSSRR